MLIRPSFQPRSFFFTLVRLTCLLRLLLGIVLLSAAGLWGYRRRGLSKSCRRAAAAAASGGGSEHTCIPAFAVSMRPNRLQTSDWVPLGPQTRREQWTAADRELLHAASCR